ALHEERLAAGAVRVAPHHHGAVAEVGEEDGGEVDVVADEVALGDAERGPEELAEIGELHPALAERDQHLVLVARDHPAGGPARRGGRRAARAAVGRGVLAPPSCGVPSGTPRRSSLRFPLSLPGSFASLAMVTRTDS